MVSLNGLDLNWRSHAMAHYWDQLVANAFGNYRQVLQDVTLNPAMGYYLNTRGNQKENAATGRQPDENYAREILQLATIGPSSSTRTARPNRRHRQAAGELHAGRCDQPGARVHRVRLRPVAEPAHHRARRHAGGAQHHFTRLPMALKPPLHSTLPATFLGTTIAGQHAGRSGPEDGARHPVQPPQRGPLHRQAAHPAAGHQQPIQRLRGACGRQRSTTTAGVRGDMKTGGHGHPHGRRSPQPRRPDPARLWQAARAHAAAGAVGAHLSSPRQYGYWKIGDTSNPGTRLSQSPLRSPSVFNFFRPGYVPPSTALAAARQVAPEFQLVNESSVGGYLNYMQGVIRSGIYANAPDVPQNASNTNNGYDIRTTYPNEMAIVTDADALVARINLLMCAGQLSATTVKLIADALKATPVTAASTEAVKLNRIAAAILLVMASAEYLIQK